MTNTQVRALWELCRQGLPLCADEAEALWQRGDSYDLKRLPRVSRSLRRLIECCNQEAHQKQMAS